MRVPGARLEPVGFDALPGFGEDDPLAAFLAFRRSAARLVTDTAAPRAAVAPAPGLIAAARKALAAPVADDAQARDFFRTHFRPCRVVPDPPAAGFLTGYYEPVVPASRVETARFCWPILARPADLVTIRVGEAPPHFPEGVTGARRDAGGRLVPYPERGRIEQARANPVVWVEDAVEAFLIQVQGSAQVEFPDGARARLAYDGRNGRPYASIGRILIEANEIAEADMSLARLKGWLRTAGAGEGGRGLALMRRNPSFVFFRLVETFDPALGPVAGAGVSLTPLRSLAVDRGVWSYALPFWIEADLPWVDAAPRPFRRLMIADDTGSAIVGPARGDLFFGSGEAAGLRAGSIRHPAAFTALMPTGEIA